ncbi:MAG: efflux RND transporter permease subunit [Limnochordia bacterium]
MRNLSRYIIEHPRLFVGINIIITLFFGFFALNIRVDDDIMNYLPEDDPVVETFNRISDTFGGSNIAVVILEADDIFTNEALLHIDHLTDLFAGVDGVTSVTSLTNAMDMRPEEDALNVDRLVKKDYLYSKAELEDLRKYVLGKELYVGSLITEDCRYSMILAKIDPDADSAIVTTALREIVNDEDTDSPFRHYRTGSAFVADDADRYAKGDLQRLLPTVVLLVLLVLLLTFRTTRATLLPIATVLIAVIWTLGLLVLTGNDLSTVGIAIPVILVAVGSAYGIHVTNEYYTSVKSERTKKEDMIRGMGQLGLPLFLSCLTTIVGFASLTTADLTPIKQLGLFTAFGVFAAFVTAYTFIPSLLVLMKYKPGRIKAEDGVNVRFERFAGGIFRYRGWITAGVIILVVIAISFYPRITYDTDYAGAFRANSSARTAIDLVNEKFGGASPMQVHFQGDLKSPFVLKQMKEVEEFLETVGVNKPLSYADIIEEANKTINGASRIPTTRNQVSSLGLFLEGQDQVTSYLTPDSSEGLIVGRVTETSYNQMTITNGQVRDFLEALPKKAYVIDRSIAGEELEEFAEEVIVDSITQELTPLLWEHPTMLEQDYVRRRVWELAQWTPAQYIQENINDVSSLVEDVYQYYLWFELDDLEGSQTRSVDALRNGDVDAIFSALQALNPNCDSYDLEDAAYLLWDEFSFEFQDSRTAKLDNVVADLLAASNLDAEWDQVSAILKDVWVDEIHVVDLPKQLITDPAVHLDEFTVELSGPPVIYEVVTTRLQSSQLRSLSLSLVLVALLLMLQLQSIRNGLVACTPIILTVLINFGVMAIAGIPLDVATTMIASVAIGTGVDYSIHFANRYRRALKESTTVEQALRTTLGQVGKAISTNALSVALGFLVLVLSSTVTVAYFGGLTALTMVVSAFLALVFLPAVFALIDKSAGNNNTTSK